MFKLKAVVDVRVTVFCEYMNIREEVFMVNFRGFNLQ
jgi:hypothetical protein